MDALDFLVAMPDNYCNLIITSPPYESARKLDFPVITGESWVDYHTTVCMESARVCAGLVCYVVNSRTHQFRSSMTPFLLAADLHRQGVSLRKPCVFHRHGIPGSGGPDWLRDDYELILCFNGFADSRSNGAALPWSDPTALGFPPKYPPGGPLSHRKQDGSRVPRKTYSPPTLANPGNIIHGSVGKGHMGSDLAHENEAPFPEWLVEFFVRSFCPEQGLVIDPFCGSGTTAAVAQRLNRHYIINDLRESQCRISLRRLGLGGSPWSPAPPFQYRGPNARDPFSYIAREVSE
jgi:site-specific DNA-methyltransferase (adenine-specific)